MAASIPGRQAVTEKLIDDLGGEEVALDWLQTQKKLAKDIEVVDWRNPVNADPTGLGFSVANTRAQGPGL